MNLDRLKNFPNQLIDGDPTECVALTVTDICANIDDQLFDPDYSYAATLRLMNQPPTTNGLDPYEGMLEAVSYGLLPITEASFNAKVMGELYVANFENYSKEQREHALMYTRRGVKPLYTFEDVASALRRTQTGVSVAVRWYDSFKTPNADGTLPPPSGNFSKHNVAVYDYDPIKGLVFKPWLGPNYGAGGYGFMNRAIFNATNLSSAVFDQNASRWLSLATILVNHPTNIKGLLPQLIALS